MAGRVDALLHPVIAVSAMSEAVRYYRDLLGLAISFDDYHDPAAIALLFGLRDPVLHAVVVGCPDGSEIELVEFERPRGGRVQREPADAGLLAVNLRVTGIADLVDRLTTGGYPPSSPIVDQELPDGGVLRVVVCRAPDDVSILLVELPAGRASLASASQG